MMRYLKHLLILLIAAAMYFGVHFALRGRFDIVACLLLVINSGFAVLFELWEVDRKRYLQGNVIAPHIDGNDYDQYVIALREYLEMQLVNYRKSGFGIDNFESIPLAEVNRMVGLRNKGKFQLRPAKGFYNDKTSIDDLHIFFLPK